MNYCSVWTRHNDRFVRGTQGYQSRLAQRLGCRKFATVSSSDLLPTSHRFRQQVTLCQRHVNRMGNCAQAKNGNSGEACLVYDDIPPVVIEPNKAATAAVIVLHGIGDDGPNFSWFARRLSRSLPYVRVIVPTAPEQPSTVHEGLRMRTWFDLVSRANPHLNEDTTGLTKSLCYVEGLIQQQIEGGIPSSRIALVGMSRGGAQSAYSLRSSYHIAAVVVLSSFLPQLSVLPLTSETNRGTAVLLCHGDADEVIPYDHGVSAFKAMKNAGVNVRLKTYKAMKHFPPSSQEVADIIAFLADVIPDESTSQ